MAKRATHKPASSPPPPPADDGRFHLVPVVDAVYLHGIAMTMRRGIADAVLPSILHDMHDFAQRGALEMLLLPDNPAGDIKVTDFLEALQPDLTRLGFTSEIIRHEIPRLGLTETKTALAISWRTPRPL